MIEIFLNIKKIKMIKRYFNNVTYMTLLESIFVCNSKENEKDK